LPADEAGPSVAEALADYVLMAMETLPADEAGPSVAEALADYVLMAMETLPADEAGPSVAEALADYALCAMGDLPVGEASTSGAPRRRLLPPDVGFMSREEYAARLRAAGLQKEIQPVQTGKAQHVYHILANSSE
jgi:hypothetical protein